MVRFKDANGMIFLDTNGLNWTPHYFAAKELTDGVKLGDSVQEYFCEVLSDGVKLGDTIQEFMFEVMSDGIKLGDPLTPIFRPQPVLADGVSLGDVIDVKQQLFPDLSDGIILSDELYVMCTFFLELEDGVVLDDQSQEYMFETLTDGFVLTDFPIYKKEKSELIIHFTAKELTQSFFTMLDEVIETLPIKAIQFSFQVKGINKTFTVNPKDYNN